MIIYNCLYVNNIVHCYEKRLTVPYDNESLCCDFYIQCQDIYIEYWRLNTPKCLKRRKEKDFKDIESVLMRAIKRKKLNSPWR